MQHVTEIFGMRHAQADARVRKHRSAVRKVGLRPVLAIQADLFTARTTVTLLLLASTLVNIPLSRVTLQPNGHNGSRKSVQVMIDKAITIKRERLGKTMGCIDAATLVELKRRLAAFLGIAKWAGDVGARPD